jgi:hypothetical protein
VRGCDCTPKPVGVHVLLAMRCGLALLTLNDVGFGLPDVLRFRSAHAFACHVICAPADSTGDSERFDSVSDSVSKLQMEDIRSQ